MTLFEDLVQALADAGLLEDEPASTRHFLIGTLKTGEDVAWTGGGAWRADGEDLAEGDIESWLGRMTAPLSDCGVELLVTTLVSPHDEGSAGYSIAVNDQALQLYTFVPDEPGLPATADPWRDCTIVPVRLVNQFLTAAASDRRIAVFWPGGNDGFAVLGNADVLRRALASGATSGSWDGLIP